jgi:Zn-dependent protease with chaperone function
MHRAIFAWQLISVRRQNCSVLKPNFLNFEASLLHPDFGNEPVEGRVLVGAGELQFESGAVSLNIPLNSLEVGFEEGGSGIYFSNAAQPDVSIFTRNQAILRHPAIKSHPQVAAVLGRREVQKALRLTLYFLGVCVVVTWLGSLALGAMTRAIAARVPPAWEEKTGKDAIGELQQEGLLLTNSNVVAQLEVLATPLVKVLPPGHRDLKFYVADNPLPNAFALPGGHVVVNAGLLQLADKPEELLGVLAHELAHQTRRHAIRRNIAAAGPMVIFGVFLHGQSRSGNLLALGSGVMVFQGFSQDYEMEADETGWDYLVAANIDPRGLIWMLRKIETNAAARALGGIAPQAFQSHPAFDKRIARLEKKWSKLPRKAGFEQIQPVNWSLDKKEN